MGNQHFWHVITRLGEAQIVVTAALLAALVLLRRSETRALAARWMVLTAVAVLVTTASKLAFIGWGVGWAELDFTGISGHTMFAAAVYPVLLATVLAGRGPPVSRHLAFTVGALLAVLIGFSRVVVGAHSMSEVVAGLLIGGMVSAGVLLARLPRVSTGPLVPAVLALFFLLMPAHAPASTTHSVVIRLSLALSGNEAPYTRAHMLLGRERARGLPAGAPGRGTQD